MRCFIMFVTAVCILFLLYKAHRDNVFFEVERWLSADFLDRGLITG